MKNQAIIIMNIVAIIAMLSMAAITIKGAEQFKSFAAINKEYVNDVIASGEAEYQHNALKVTETARAMAYDQNVQTMNVMVVLCIVISMVGVANLWMLTSGLKWRNRRRLRFAPMPI